MIVEPYLHSLTSPDSLMHMDGIQCSNVKVVGTYIYHWGLKS
jgi:hypothetical protein